MAEVTVCLTVPLDQSDVRPQLLCGRDCACANSPAETDFHPASHGHLPRQLPRPNPPNIIERSPEVEFN